MKTPLDFTAIALVAAGLLVACLGDAGLASAEPAAAATAPRADQTWDDRHMRTRFPRRAPASQGPRLILPEGSEHNTIPEGRTLYATPDRNWQSGPSGGSTLRSRRSSGVGPTLISPGSTVRSATSRSSSVRGSSMSTRR